MNLTAAIVLLSASASAWTADKASSRRDVLNKVAGAAAVVAAPGVAGAYSVPDLEYGFDALEPFMYVASYVGTPAWGVDWLPFHGLVASSDVDSVAKCKDRVCCRRC